MLSNGIIVKDSRSITFQDIDFKNPQYRGSGGNGYMFNTTGQECLFRDIVAEGGRHSLSFAHITCSGNVVYNLTSLNPWYALDFHNDLSMTNLIDSTTLNNDKIHSAPRYQSGPAGQTTSQSVFWNTNGILGEYGANHSIESFQYGHGYIIGTKGWAYDIRTHPVIYVAQDVTRKLPDVDTSPEDWTEGIGAGETLVPQSLYLDQLARRLGMPHATIPIADVDEIDDTYQDSSVEDPSAYTNSGFTNNTIVIVVIAILVVLIIVIGLYFYKNKKVM